MSSAFERNKQPIKDILQLYLNKPGNLLEIGSGTGDHALYFAKQFADIVWFPSDRESNIGQIQEKVGKSNLPNLKDPYLFEIGKHTFPPGEFDFVFSANSLHIMSWKLVVQLTEILGEFTQTKAICIFYGPFNYNGQYTSVSNQEFDVWLKSRDDESGIRDFEKLTLEMKKHNFNLINDHPMPANNRMLVFVKK